MMGNVGLQPSDVEIRPSQQVTGRRRFEKVTSAADCKSRGKCPFKGKFRISVRQMDCHQPLGGADMIPARHPFQKPVTCRVRAAAWRQFARSAFL